MDAVFVDWNVEFEEAEGTSYPIDVAAPVLYFGEVILWVLRRLGPSAFRRRWRSSNAYAAVLG